MLSVTSIMILFLLFQFKHFVCDFLYQPPYMWQNKGTYGHPGGLYHSAFHGIVTLLIALFFVSVPFAIIIALVEMIIHYHIDWAKMNVNAHYGWKSDKNNQFWIALGVDQLLHQLTYIGLVFWMYKGW